jgi:type II secretory pathway pseudopilin PulG
MTRLSSFRLSGWQKSPRGIRGFTLAELAVVLTIIILLVGGTVMTLAAQDSVRQVADTRRTLELAREALIGFAVANQRLPCPAGAASGGQELPAGGGACTITLSAAGPITAPGFLPAVTLGIGPTNPAGLLVDAWGNPIRYAVTGVNGNAFTTTNGLKNLAYTGVTPDLVVCVNLTGAAATAPCNTLNRTATNVALVLYSPGKSHVNPGPLGADELNNINDLSQPVANTPIFVSRELAPDFDDTIVSISHFVLFNRLISAGAL